MYHNSKRNWEYIHSLILSKVYLFSTYYEYSAFLNSRYIAENKAHKVLHSRGGDRQYTGWQIHNVISESMKKNETGQRTER